MDVPFGSRKICWIALMNKLLGQWHISSYCVCEVLLSRRGHSIGIGMGEQMEDEASHQMSHGYFVQLSMICCHMSRGEHIAYYDKKEGALPPASCLHVRHEAWLLLL